ncbi:glycoside hydrolase [Neoconidiobolus thromboides FSU 785]|nr:glycoside hydrolase [Neoconidiobolus thromboides FSU 785]
MGQRTCIQRFKWLIIGSVALVVVLAIVLGVVFGVVIPNQNSPTSSSNIDSGKDGETPDSDNGGSDPKKGTQNNVKMNVFTKPDLTKIPNDLGDFDNDAVANSYSVALKDKFDYTTKKVRGVNLGGWLVPEPFIVPSLYSNHTSKPVEDEWSLCTELGKEKCQKVLANHYNKFITEDDIKDIADAGLNHVRIPIGHWAIDIEEDEPFVYGGWKYLLRSIQWCRKYGIRVMLDFHAVPGSQNGWNHSGRAGKVRFLNPEDPDSSKNEERFLKVLKDVVTYFNKKEFRNVVTMIGVINEPNTFVTNNVKGIADFYRKSYKLIREATGDNKDLIISYHDAFKGLQTWPKELPEPTYNNIAIDAHNYVAFDPNFATAPEANVIAFPCQGWRDSFIESKGHFALTVSAEFSLAPNDCGLNLNGVGNGAKYDGTFFDAKPACPTCKCDKFINYKGFTDNYKKFLKSFVEAQMDAFEEGSGWFFWTYRTENGVNPGWDYSLGLKNGWIPKDAGKREISCAMVKNSK